MAGTDALWMHDAACRNRDDLDWFDTDCDLQACLDVCRTCPVRIDCRDYAVAHDLDEGVWGGVWGYRLRKAGRGRAGRGTDAG